MYLIQTLCIDLQSWTKVLGHFCVSGVFFNSHRSNPSPHPTNNVGRVYPEFFSEIQLCIGLYRVGEGELQQNFENDAVFRGSREMTENMHFAVLSQGLLSRIVATVN